MQKSISMLMCLAVTLILGGVITGCQPKYEADEGAVKALADAGLIQGEHYDVLPRPLYAEKDLSERVHVTEFFWYGCSHCFKVERPLQLWLKSKPPQIEFEKLPAMWSKAMEMHAQMYFVAKKIGHPQLSYSLFPAILSLEKVEAIEDQKALLQRHFAGFSIDAEELASLSESEETVAQVERADKLQRQAKINGTPAFIIDGIYRIENKSVEHLPEVIALIDKFSKTLLRYKLKKVPVDKKGEQTS